MKGIFFGTLSVDKFSTSTWAQFFLLALQELKIYISRGPFKTRTR